MPHNKTLNIFTQFFPPVKDGGGVPLSISNLCSKLSQFNFTIYTNSSDLANNSINLKLKNKKLEERIIRDNKIYQNPLFRKNILNKKKETIYFNSFYSFNNTILPLIKIFKYRSYKKIIIAPRGELYKENIKLKFIKKNIYNLFFKFFFLTFYKIHFHFTSNNEYQSAIKIFDIKKYQIIENLLNLKTVKNVTNNNKYLFFSRIDKKKNLLNFLLLIENINFNSKFYFDIYGNYVDKNYFNKCIEVISRLNKKKNVFVKYKGFYDNKLSLLKNYSFLIHPSLNENFGHVFFEFLSIGVPLIVPKKSFFKYSKSYCFDLKFDHRYLQNMFEYINTLPRKTYSQMGLDGISYIIKRNHSSSKIMNKYINFLFK